MQLSEMTKQPNGNRPALWIDGELRLGGLLDSRIIALLRAIEQTGSINRAARQVGLSYKGAWQMIERANNGAPKILVSTATGGSKGGGTSLTEAGRSLLALFTQLEEQHRQFIEQLNRSLAGNADAVLLLQRLVVKTSARNQLFGRISGINEGAVNSEVAVTLKGGEALIVSITKASLTELGIEIGADAVLLINSADIMLSCDADQDRMSSRNRLLCTVLRIQQDDVEAEVNVLLPGGEVLSATITGAVLQELSLEPGKPVWAMFKSNAPILGVLPSGR